MIKDDVVAEMKRRLNPVSHYDRLYLDEVKKLKNMKTSIELKLKALESSRKFQSTIQEIRETKRQRGIITHMTVRTNKQLECLDVMSSLLFEVIDKEITKKGISAITADLRGIIYKLRKNDQLFR